jgi:hypothetical protein
MHFRRAPDRHQAPSARLFRGSKSSRRIDFEERIRIAICRPPKFCSYSKPRSTVSSTSNLEASAAVRRSPFSSPLKPAYRADWHSETGQVISQTPGNTFVKKDLHPSWPTSAALASSSAVMASWRLTEGKSSRNSSRVSPALR